MKAYSFVAALFVASFAKAESQEVLLANLRKLREEGSGDTTQAIEEFDPNADVTVETTCQQITCYYPQEFDPVSCDC